MANRKSIKPTRCLPSSKDNPAHQLLNFGFLFKRDSNSSVTSSNVHVKRQNSSFNQQASANLHQSMQSELYSSQPHIKFTALMSCAELIQSSIKDKHQIESIFPYFDLLKKYKSGRSASLSPVETEERFSDAFPTIQSNSPSKKIFIDSIARVNSVQMKSKRSSSMTPFTNSTGNDRSSNSFHSDLQLESFQSQQLNDDSFKQTLVSSESDHDELNNSQETPSKLSSKKIPKCKRRCASCGANKTPYWRDGWEKGVLLCNACGIRYQKYKKYCLKCHSIARKDDKGRLHCPECNDKL